MAAKFQVISFSDPTSQVREHKKRKFHAKTRAGCVACKQKRVKCDEARPACNRCQRNNRPCLYDTTGLTSSRRGRSPQSDSSVELVPSPRRSPSAFSTVQAVLPVDSATKYGGTPAGVLLEFFNENYMYMLAGASLPLVWEIACQFPHLLTAILSASACYLRHHSADPLPHRVAEMYQQTLTVKNFQKSLEQPLDKERSDALILTSIFLNLLAFTEVLDDDPAKSWVFSGDPGRLGWMTILLGFKPLLMASVQWMPESVLVKMYQSTDDKRQEHTGQQFDKFELPPAWKKFLHLNYTEPAIDPEAVFALYSTGFVPPDMENLYVFMQFFGRLDTPFRDLLFCNDERALWMIGYWFGLLGRLDSWFSRVRVRRDYTAILMGLQALNLPGRPGEEGQMWLQLMNELEALKNDWHPSNLSPNHFVAARLLE